MENDPTETADPGPFRKMARALLDELLQDELAGESNSEAALAVAASRALDQGAAIAEALAAEVAIFKNRWWEQSRHPAGIPQGGRFADMGRGRAGSGRGGGGVVTVSNTPMADRIVPAAATQPAPATNGANGAPRGGPASRSPASPATKKGPWSDQPNAAFRVFIANEEKSADKPNDGYGEFNPRSRELGRYQIKPASLLQIGWLERQRDGALDWSAKARAQGVSDNPSFLANPRAQEAAFTEYLRDNDRQLRMLGATRFLGTAIVGLEGTFKITEAGLAAAAHRHGATGLLEYLRGQARRNFRSNSLMTPAEREIETRLREAEHVRYEAPR